MSRQFRQFTLLEYRDWLYRQQVSRRINHIQIHHTWKPRKTDYQGERTIVAMYRYHTSTQGWQDIAQHVSIAPDGTIWDGRSLELDPAGIAGNNRGGYMIEMIGNFDQGEERLEGEQLHTVLGLVNVVMMHFGLNTSAIVFHREHSDKSCPGNGLSKTRFVQQVVDWAKHNPAVLDKNFVEEEVSPVMSDVFRDLPQEHYATEAIEALAELGIIQGKGDGSFGLGEPIKREDAALLIYRLYQHLKQNP